MDSSYRFGVDEMESRHATFLSAFLEVAGPSALTTPAFRSPEEVLPLCRSARRTQTLAR